jgi:phosphate transport system substrate-binding protein
MRMIGLILGTAACLSAGAGLAQETPPPMKPGQIIWVEPSAPTIAPQTDAEKKAGMEVGRTLPAPELLQPELDPALPHYVPTKGLRIKAHFRAGVSDVLPGLASAWLAAFRKYHPGFQLDLVKPYAGSLGALELIKGNLDLVLVSRELKPTDISGFRDKFGYDPFSVPISGGTWRHFGFLDAIAFMVNPQNPVRSLTFAQLDAAFSATRLRGGTPIKTWGDLGVAGDWADRPVHLYGIKPWNGFEEFVRQHVLSVSGRRGEWNDKIHYDETFFNIARRVAADPYALGYTGLSASDSEIKILPVTEGDGPPLTPSYENVASAAYPLSRVLYLNANARSGAALNPALREFLRFVLSREGQAVVRAQGIYLPLRAAQVARSQAYIDRK